MRQTFPATRDIVLIGGGHAHALLLRMWGMRPLAGARLTLVNPGPTAPYTGMLPGFVAGHYDRETLEIDLVRLARFAGARLILGQAVGIDRAAREVVIEDSLIGRRRVGYDVASLDIGIHSEMPAIPGFAEHAVAAKPLGRFAEAWARHRAAGGRDAGIAVIGAGVGGCELAMAMSFGMGGAPVTVIEHGQALTGMGARARRRLLDELKRNHVTLIEHAGVARIDAEGLDLTDGRRIPARFVTGAAGAHPHTWLARTGLDLTDGFVTVDAHLRSSDPAIFAAGDCAHLSHAPRPKAGVFAVRQAPVLHANLRAAVSGGRIGRYRPQRDYLKLISTGRKAAVAEKFGHAFSGALLWTWKDRIDRKFMRKLDELPRMAQFNLPADHAEGLDRLTRQAPCAGCGAKVGRGTLAAALSRMPAVPHDDLEAGPGDDAAILRMGAMRQVVTVDQLRAFTEDAGLLARIAALHALGDCHAMGAEPQALLPVLTLPRQSPRLEARMLSEIMAALAPVAQDSGAAIAGGHSATGAEMQIGLTVTGLLDGPGTPLGAGRPGDVLILTKPLGTGVVLAGEMALDARGAEVAATWTAMADSHLTLDLSAARAVTDVTGFGLAGHLMGLCEASGTGAELSLDALPLLPGAERLLRAGTRSTLHEQNREVAATMTLPDDPRIEILFDPQTAGGYLCAVPPEAAEGFPGTRIGRLTDGPPFIKVTSRPITSAT
ncbi:selenide, water dikinase SelD [Palleronia sp.]|uniref:selenide, water dikinase SelD n=1 Tax=Palleronia sp. TaxID=1940284 RepID=UPI0035C78DD9